MSDQQPLHSSRKPESDKQEKPGNPAAFLTAVKERWPGVRARIKESSGRTWRRFKSGYQKTDGRLLDTGDKIRTKTSSAYQAVDNKLMDSGDRVRAKAAPPLQAFRDDKLRPFWKNKAVPLGRNLRDNKWPRAVSSGKSLWSRAAGKSREGWNRFSVNAGRGWKSLRVRTASGWKKLSIRSADSGRTFRVRLKAGADQARERRQARAAAKAYKPYKYRGLYNRLKRHGRQKVYRLKGYTTVARVDRKRRRERLRHQRNQLIMAVIIVTAIILLFFWLDPVPKVMSLLQDIGFLEQP